jgi:hypothetical protein
LNAQNEYFAQFDGFEQDYDATFLNNFKRLAIREKWSKKQQRRHRLDAFDAEFDFQIGTDLTRLETWQEMCRDCLIEPIPPSITKCKKART